MMTEPRTNGSTSMPSAIQSAGLGRRGLQALVAVVLVLTPLSAGAEDWIDWRGPQHIGVSEAKGLVSTWSRDGENLAWRQDFRGRSTPVVLNGRVFAQGRAGDGPDQREVVAAFDAKTGEKLWERIIPAFLTTVPYTRAGWSSPVADRETGYIYVQGIGGAFMCLDQDGKTVWERSLYEEYGRFSGYGGRTHTPLIDEDRLIVSIVNAAWGSLGPPRHRYYSFDKRTGEILWISTPGLAPEDLNAQSNVAVAVINGRRLYIGGNADGQIYALEARTGEKVWSFDFSKRGLNSDPIVVGTTVFVGQSEENIDEAVLGRIIAIDGTGSGDVTKTHELWRRNISMGFPSPAYFDGRLYVMDNSGNLWALNPASGATHWEYSTGTVGKSAPVIADGKLYVTEVNGKFHILELNDEEPKVLDVEEISMPNGRSAEIYGSPAIAYGRVYFTTEEGIYCLAKAGAPYQVSASGPLVLAAEDRGSDQATVLRVVPAEIRVDAGSTTKFQVWAFNEKGRKLGAPDAHWSLDKLQGQIDAAGSLEVSAQRSQAGEVVAKVGDLEARARVRSFTGLPMTEDFDFEGRGRPYWISAGRFQVAELDGNKVLEKPVAETGLLRSMMFVGPENLSNYTVEADIRGGQKGRRKTDGGVVNSGYFLDLLGIDQVLEVKSWTAERRMAVKVPFAWDMDVWYRMKMRVEQHPGKAMIFGKVWKKGSPEPTEWTLTAEDPYPVVQGAPGLQAYSPASFYFDNLLVTKN